MPSRRLPVLLAAACLAGALSGPALADALPAARERAQALRADVAALQVRTEQAVEQYDAAEEQLARAVAAQSAAQAELAAAQDVVSAGTGTRRARVRTLYELGGPAAWLGSVLSARSPVEALQGVHQAQRLLGVDARTMQAEAHQEAERAQAAQAAGTAARDQVQATARVAALAGEVHDLLARQQAQLASADAQVVELLRQQQEQAEQQAARDFAARLAAARGALPAVGATAVPASGRAAAVLTAAYAQLGKPYVWGASGPDSYDCSGLTRWAFAAAGVALPRTAAQQWATGPHPGLADLQPGDLLFWASDPGDAATIHHVALYAGAGRMVAAPHTGALVQVQPVYAEGFFGATRVG